jgi:hypothetical protein
MFFLSCLRSFHDVAVIKTEQAGLTDAKGAIVRKAAVGRSVSNLQQALTTIKSTLEGRPLPYTPVGSVVLNVLG